MKYLGIEEEQLKQLGAIDTAREIASQPELWKAVSEQILNQQDKLTEYLTEVSGKTKKVILTGAGTSAYVGLSLRGSFQRHMNIETETVPTTDLVTHPLDYLSKDDILLLISFARSGNSPESLAAVNLADQFCKECYHLIITCDKHGQLAGYIPKTRKFVFVLPPESNDRSLAMTGSYSGMLLAGLLIANIKRIASLHSQITSLIQYGNKILGEYTQLLRSMAEQDFKRAAFLGSGPLFGTATESHLKLQELTDGRVICKNETYLGFRHGPKAIIDPTTLVVYILSNNPQVQAYESDLIDAMKKGRPPMLEIAICEENHLDKKFDLTIQLSDSKNLEEEFLTVCCILPAQILGFFKSMTLGMSPDSPSESGAISRVVEGVKIYSYNGSVPV